MNCIICNNETNYPVEKLYCSYKCLETSRNRVRAKKLEKTKELDLVIKSLPQSNYQIDIELYDIRSQFEKYNEYDGFEYNPDFQRGYVWTVSQQIAFIEGMLRGTVGNSQMIITLNCPFHANELDPNQDISGYCIIDGLQRVTAILDFIDGKFKVFNKYSAKDLDGSKFSLRRKNIKVQIFGFTRKVDLLKYYIDINSGGTVHSDDEINRVKDMIGDLNE